MAASKAAALPLGDRPAAIAIAIKEMVRKERLELSHLAAPEPKSGASTNFATSATYSVDNSTWIDYIESSLCMAGLPGFEPGMTGSEPVALPLGDRPAVNSLEALVRR